MEEEQEAQVTLQDYLRILYRRRWVIVVAFLAVVSSTLFFTLKATKIYEATTTIMIGGGGGGEGALSLFGMPGYIAQQTRINNQVEILKSYTLAESVIDKLRDLPNHEAFTLFSSSVGDLSEEEKVEVFRKRLEINPIRDTDIIEIKVEAPSPEEAVVVANTVAEAFYQMNMETARGEISEVRKFLEEQLGKVKGELTESEEALKEFKQREKLAALPTETEWLVRKLADFEGLYNEAKTDLGASQRRLAYLREQLREQQENLPEEIAGVSSPFIQQLREEIAKLEVVHANFIAQGIPEDHPKMVKVKRRIRETKGKLVAKTKELLSKELVRANPLAFSEELVDKILKLEVDVETFQARTKALKKVVDEYSRKLLSLPENSLQLARLERAAKVDEKIYIMMMEKYEEARITEAGQIGNVRIVDRAREPKHPIKPKKRLNMILGALVGLGLGVGVAFLLEYLDTSIKTVEDVEKTIGLAVLGTIPDISVEKEAKNPEKSLADDAEKIAAGLITHFESKSPISEAYRILRTNIRFAKLNKPLRTLLITSSGPGEGKSTTVANLAITMAQREAKVLLIDADLRRPIQHSIFKVEGREGLTEVLVGEKGLSSAIKKTMFENLSLIPCGLIPPNPSELLDSQMMRELLEGLKEEYDIILIDSPPILVVTDAAILGSIVDGVALVIRSGKVNREAVNRARTLLENVEARTLGIILNGVDLEGSYYGYYREYYPHRKISTRKRWERG